MVTSVSRGRGRSSPASAAFALAALLCLPSAQALTTGYDNQADYASALAAAGLSGSGYGFPMPVLGTIDPGSFTVGPATFAGQNASNGGSFLGQDDYGLAGDFYSHQLFNGRWAGIEQPNLVLIQFATPVRAFAFSTDVWNFGGPPWARRLADQRHDADEAGHQHRRSAGLHDARVESGLPVGSAPIGFSGLVSDTPFDSVLVTVTQGQNFQVAEFNVAAVPEPAMPMLMLAGLMAVGAAVRQTRRRPD